VIFLERKPLFERLREIQESGLSREEIFKILYVEKYPIFEITEALGFSSDELKEVNDRLKIFLLRCPVGHKFIDDPALHTSNAHYCVECKRWFNESTLMDEINLEIKRLKEREMKIMR
jgi:hypothetical protein